ncbi:MAG: FAD/NAD(P)-binding protein [Corynebacterium sp.]|uniref:FAD/NAD(P)-binding protein n=1 Tax=Corynebacterium sp. TaxID=1720 RepID=UPI003F91C1D6
MAVNSPDLRVAIIGAGPRGLWAAEELLDQARAHGVRVAVDVWDDRAPGAGSAYGTEQPDHWTMNVSSHIVTSALGSFDGWRRQFGRGSDADPFPPRSLVGRFFAESWQALLDSTRQPDSGCTLHIVAARVTDLGELEGYDEVLLATGHARTWPGALPPTVGSGDVPAVPVVGVYPPDGLRRIAAGAVVDVRGAALTFVDAALELTLGRGGSVVPADGGWVYRRGGSEPAAIRPLSRTGRFMTVKPEPGSPLAGLLPSDGLAAEERRVRVSRDLGELREAVACAADRLLDMARGTEDKELVRRVIAGTDTGVDAVTELRSSHAVATGAATPDAAWAVGHAWRSLYPAIVWRTSHGRRSSLPGFAALARALERVAFGLPPHNAARLLALIDAGIVHAPARAEVGTLTPPADVVVDAVLAPPGDVPGTLSSGTGWVDAEGQVVGRPGLSVVGRDADASLTGADSLNRSLHDVVPRWARRVVKAHGPRRPGNPGAEGTVPLPARLEPWMVELLGDAGACRALLEEHGSPVNVLRTAPMVRNMAELRDAGADAGVETRVFYARKANKALCFVDTALRAGHGVDVASERELCQVLDRGVPGDRVILSAAVKPDRLLQLAVDNAVTVSVDNVAELHRLSRLSRLSEQGDGAPAVRARIAPRVSPDPERLPPTRFGERPAIWRDALVEVGGTVEVVGAHVHLHGYSAADRRLALVDALQVTDAATELGHRPEFVDLGGGVPMSYLDDGSRWEAFLDARRAMVDSTGASFTWKSDPLANTYPFHQSPVRGDWLRGLLDGSVADALIRRGLRLHLEPGRAVLDGCGMILARVAFLKDRSDGVPLVGVEMNRTQCRTTSDDILVDPLLVRQRTPGTGRSGRPERGPDAEGFLVGAYCIEDEVIIRRRMRFPEGISTGDTLVVPNTAGYFMHILESASHQIPLARNVVRDGAQVDGARVDDIDR